jgi:hypothetical protein
MLPILVLFLGLAGVDVEIQPPPPQQRVLGIIDFGDDGMKDVLTAPKAVRLGEIFEVTITTFGGGCENEGDTSVVLLSTGAAITVYDFTVATHPGVICTAVIKRMPHTVNLRFEKPGEAIIQIWGRRVRPETPPFGLPTVLEHRVTVR